MDLSSGQQVRTLPNAQGGATFSPDSSKFAYAAFDDTVRLWSVEGSQEFASLGSTRRPIVWDAQSTMLLTAGRAENQVVVFGLTAIDTTEFVRWNGAGLPVSFTADNDGIIVQNAALQQWSLGSAAQIAGDRTRGTLGGGEFAGVQDMFVSGSAQRVLTFVSGPDSGRALLSDPNNFNNFALVDVSGHEDGVIYTPPTMSADGSVALTNGYEGLYTIDMQTGKAINRQMLAENMIHGRLALSANGKQFMYTTEEGVVLAGTEANATKVAFRYLIVRYSIFYSALIPDMQ